MSRTSVVISDARGNAVDRAGKDLADAHGAHGVDGSCRFCRRFQRQNQFGGGGERVFAARHQFAAGVAAFAFNHDALAGRRGNVRHQANVESFLLEVRPLLDVQLDKLVKAPAGHRDGFERTGKSGLRAPLFQAAAFLVAQRKRLLLA